MFSLELYILLSMGATEFSLNAGVNVHLKISLVDAVGPG